MKLSLVIPVFNDTAGLSRLLGQIAQLGIASEVVVVDDGSDPPCRASFPANPVAGANVVWLRTDAGLGAGHARNLGQAAATGSHVLFFDADDTLSPEIAVLLQDLDGLDFDFCIFAHDDSRLLARGLSGPQEPPDRAYWADVAPGERPRLLSPDEASVLCRVSNYPWNKIWRRGFLLDAGVRCTEIPLHNDIEPHWAGFISARRIMVSGRRCAVHMVGTGPAQLSARRGAERIRLFEALGAVISRLENEMARDPACAAFVGPFLEFSCRLVDWAQTRLDIDEIRALHQRSHAFMATLAQSASPALADAVEQAMIDEPGLAAQFISVFGQVR